MSISGYDLEKAVKTLAKTIGGDTYTGDNLANAIKEHGKSVERAAQTLAMVQTTPKPKPPACPNCGQTL